MTVGVAVFAGRRVSVAVGVTAGTVNVSEGRFVIVGVMVGEGLGVEVFVWVAVADVVPVIVEVGVIVWVAVGVSV